MLINLQLNKTLHFTLKIYHTTLHSFIHTLNIPNYIHAFLWEYVNKPGLDYVPNNFRCGPAGGMAVPSERLLIIHKDSLCAYLVMIFTKGLAQASPMHHRP